jgi:hypothetical protein
MSRACPRCGDDRDDVMKRQVGTRELTLCPDCADIARATRPQATASEPPTDVDAILGRDTDE